MCKYLNNLFNHNSKIYLTNYITNDNAHNFGQADKYYLVDILTKDNTIIPAEFTYNQIEQAVRRSLRNRIRVMTSKI